MKLQPLKKISLIFLLFFIFSFSYGFGESEKNLNTESSVILFKEFKALKKEIIKLQNKVIENNKKLQIEIDNMNNMITKQWEENIKKFNVNTSNFKNLKEKVKNPHLSKEEKQRLMADLKEEAHKFYNARKATFTNKKIMDSQKKLSKKLKQETIKTNPDSAEVYSKFEELEKKIMGNKNFMN